MLLLLLSLANAASFPPPRGGATFGLGLGAGFGIAGLSGKYWMGSHNAVQAMIGGYGGGYQYAHYGYYGRLGIGADYLWEFPALVSGAPLILGWNAGAGASVGIGEIGRAHV